MFSLGCFSSSLWLTTSSKCWCTQSRGNQRAFDLHLLWLLGLCRCDYYGLMHHLIVSHVISKTLSGFPFLIRMKIARTPPPSQPPKHRFHSYKDMNMVWSTTRIQINAEFVILLSWIHTPTTLQQINKSTDHSSLANMKKWRRTYQTGRRTYTKYAFQHS